MRCLICYLDKLPTSTKVCPNCSTYLTHLLQDTLPTDTKLNNGLYRIDYAIGRGGFGITYRGMHTQLEYLVAIKEFFPEGNARRGSIFEPLRVVAQQSQKFDLDIQQFIHEGRILAGLKHPGIVGVHDLFEERGTAYLVMDYIEGQRLEEELHKTYGKPQSLPRRKIYDIIGQLVTTLEYLHDIGIYHLDIKPENIIITPTGRVVLVDFGAARRKNSYSPAQQFVQAYMPPELPQGDVGPQSDLFELGMLTHELLTAKLPPSAGARALKAPLELLDVDMHWRKSLFQALQFSMDKRPKSVKIWWEASPGYTGRSSRLLSRRRVLMGGVALLATVSGEFLYAEPLPDALGTTFYTYRGYTSSVYTALWSHDGNSIASAGIDKIVRVWEATSGKSLLEYKDHTSAVYTLVQSPDGKYIASAGADKIVRVWDARTGKTVLVYKGHTGSIYTLSWSPDGGFITSAGIDKVIRVWDARTGKTVLVYKGHTGSIYTLSWSLDGKSIASGDANGMVELWDAQTGKKFQSYRGDATFISSVAWISPGNHIVTGGSSATVKVWNVATGRLAFECKGHTGAVRAVACSLDGKYFASGSDDETIIIWEADSGYQVLTYRGHTKVIRDVSWAPNSMSIASVSNDRTVKIWKAAY